jgi:RNA recognition motif-containing protein
MSSNTLFVSNFPFATTDTDLREIFEKYSPISNIRVITDRQTGRSRGYAFVEMEDPSVLPRAIEELNETSYRGRRLVVNEAKGRPGEAAPNGDRPAKARPLPPFRYRIVVQWQEDSHEYDAEGPELGVHGAGDTPEGAMRDAIRHAETAREDDPAQECLASGLTSHGF